MNNKKAKALRKQISYNPNIQRVTSEDCNIEDKSTLFGMVPAGINPDGTTKYEQLIVNKCLVTIHPDHMRSIYKKAKKETK